MRGPLFSCTAGDGHLTPLVPLGRPGGDGGHGWPSRRRPGSWSAHRSRSSLPGQPARGPPLCCLLDSHPAGAPARAAPGDVHRTGSRRSTLRRSSNALLAEATAWQPDLIVHERHRPRSRLSLGAVGVRSPPSTALAACCRKPAWSAPPPVTAALWERLKSWSRTFSAARTAVRTSTSARRIPDASRPEAARHAAAASRKLPCRGGCAVGGTSLAGEQP